MENFDIAKYLKENHLGPHSILGGYVDLHALKEVEDMKGWKMVKDFGALKNKAVADKYAEVERTGNDDLDVEVVNKDGVYKIYTRAKKELNKEADYGNNEPVDEVPYVGTDKKLDGFGDEFDQVAPVEEAEGSNIVTLLYNDHPSIEREDVDILIDQFKEFVNSLGGDAEVVKDSFDEIVFELSGISSEKVKAYFQEKIKDAPYDYNNPFVDLGSWELDIQRDNSMTGDPGWEYTDKDFPGIGEGANSDYYDNNEDPFAGMQDNDDRFAYTGGDEIKAAIKNLMDDGFPTRDIAQFVVDTIRSFKK